MLDSSPVKIEFTAEFAGFAEIKIGLCGLGDLGGSFSFFVVRHHTWAIPTKITADER
jgi:hypothetical protein